MAVFLRKLLRVGGLPAELRTEVEAESIIYLAEYLPVTRRFSGSVPGKRANTNIASYVGSLVLTSQRVLGTLSSVPARSWMRVRFRRRIARVQADCGVVAVARISTGAVGSHSFGLGQDPRLAPAPAVERQADQRSDEWVDRYRMQAEGTACRPDRGQVTCATTNIRRNG